VERTFRYKADASTWLDAEEVLVRDHWAGRSTWKPWQEREKERKAKLLAASTTLEKYAEQKYQHFRKQDGSEPTESYKRKLREYLSHLSEAPFWTEPLGNITPEKVTDWKNNNNLAPTPRLRAWQELKKLMKQAEDEGLITKSPVVGHAPKIPPSQQAKIPPATAEELQAIYTALPEYDRIAVYIASIFDLRISEVLALQVQDIDLNRGILHVRHGLGRGAGDKGYLRLKRTKTASSTADQPIPEAMISLLKAQIAGKPPDSPLIVSPRTGGILSDKALRAQFEKARIHARRPDLHFHTLRKTAITAAAASGATLSETMRYGRHSDAKTSIIRYQDAGGEARQRAIAENVASQLLPQKRTREVVEQELAETKKRLLQLEKELKAFS
jgi:integrase